MASEKKKKKAEPKVPAEMLEVGPRPEAGAFAYDALTDQQKDAFRRALKFAHSIATQKWTAPSEAASADVDLFLPYLEPPRANQVLLIDGGRGSGKTSVLLSLLKLWSDVVRNKTEAPPAKPKTKSYDPGLLQPQGTIVPLGLIDLHPLPDSTSLLLHLAGPMQRVIEAMERRVGRPAAARWEPAAAAELASRRAWREFARVVASGWDENLRARAAALDPETYARELEQTERDRYDVRGCFTRLVNCLVDDYQRWQGLTTTPLFVLAFDDADMNPALSVELAQLLMTLWHARVLFLATGHSELFTNSLRRHYLGAMRRMIPQSVTAGELQRLGDAEEPARLARQAYDKAIPAGQRLALDDLAPEFRLAFREVRQHDGPQSPNLETLFQGISIVSWGGAEMEVPGDPKTLLDYFGADSQIHEALPGNIRKLIELQRKIQVVLRQEPSQGTHLWPLVRLWQSALDDPALLPGEVRRLSKCVTRNADRGALLVNATPLQLSNTGSYPTTPFKSERAKHVRASPQEWTSFRIGDKTEAELPAQVTACLMLATNVAADVGFFYGKSPATATADIFGYSTFALSERRDVTFYWPMPEWESFLDAALVARLTNIASSTETHDDFDSLVKNRVLAATTVGLGRENASEPLDLTTSWETLAKYVHALTEPSDVAHPRRRGLLTRWARSQAGLFACPEYGLSPDAASTWLSALGDAFGEREWSTVRAELAEERERRLKVSLDHTRDGSKGNNTAHMSPEALLAEIESVHPGHPGNALKKAATEAASKA